MCRAMRDGFCAKEVLGACGYSSTARKQFACPIFVSFGELAFVKERYRSTRVLKANSLRKTQARVLNRLVFYVRERRLRRLRHFVKTSKVLFCSISTLNYSNSNNNRGS